MAWRRSKTGQIIWYINRTYRVLPTHRGFLILTCPAFCVTLHTCNRYFCGGVIMKCRYFESWHRRTLAVAVSMAASLVATGAVAAPVDLSTWTAESYQSVAGFGDGVWTVSADGSSVHQSVNGQPTLFYSDFNAHGISATGSISVSGGDDDFIGFVLGFQPGDSTNALADYLLVDWKRGSQAFKASPLTIESFGIPKSSHL